MLALVEARSERPELRECPIGPRTPGVVPGPEQVLPYSLNHLRYGLWDCVDAYKEGIPYEIRSIR